MNTIRSLYRALTSVVILLVAGGTTLVGQDRADPVSMGTARASVATSRGLGAIFSNPGALDFGPNDRTALGQKFTFALYNLGGTLGSTFLSSSDFQQIFGRTEGWPNQEDRKRLGELLQAERLFANASNNLLVARYNTPSGTFGLHYGHRIFSRLNFPSDFSTVLAEGQLFNNHYEFINRGIGGSWITELGLSYGITAVSSTETSWFPVIGLGATAKLIMGVGHFELGENSIITVDRVTTSGVFGYRIRGGYISRSAEPDGFNPGEDFSQFQTGLFPATAGTGFGFDLGVSGVLYRLAKWVGPTDPNGVNVMKGNGNAVLFGIVLHDIGSISWDKNTYRRTETNIDDIIPNAILNDEQFSRYQGTLERIPAYSTSLPASIRVGLAVNVDAYDPEMEQHMQIGLEGELPLNEAAGNSPDPRVSLGGSVGINDWLTLRTGIRAGGVSNVGVGLGVGVRPLDWLSIDIGSSEIDAFFTGERIDLAIRVSAGLGD